MPFDINNVPFYKAIALFEAEKYQEAFDIFAECAVKGNLIAPFYLENMLQNMGGTIKIQEKHAAFLKTLAEYIAHIPCNISRKQNPKAWIDTSLILIRLRITAPSKKDLQKLNALFPYASNAALFLYQYYDRNGKTTLKINILDDMMMNHANLFVVFHVNNLSLPSILESTSEQLQMMRLEWKIMQDMKEAFFSNSGNGERLFSAYYCGEDLKKSNPFKKDLHRKYLWQIQGAYQGNKQLQYLFSRKDVNAELTEEEKERWERIAAQNGEIHACIEFGMQCSGKGDFVQARTFLEKGLNDSVKTQVPPSLRAWGFTGLGRLHEMGRGGFEKDESLALKCYLEAESLGSYVGAGNVGVFYEHGKGGLEKNYQKAIAQYQKAIEGVSAGKAPEIKFYHDCMARLYSIGGFGIDKDLKQTAEHCRLACPTELWSLEKYARMLISGKYVEKNVKQGIEFLIQAADRGSMSAIYEIIRLYNNHVIEAPLAHGLTEAKLIHYIDLFIKEYGNNPADLPYSLAGRFYFELLEKPDYKKAFEYFSIGAQNNEIPSLIRMGYIYEKGFEPLGIEPDHKKAYDYYHLATELGSPIALNNKAHLLAAGIGLQKNTVQAKQLFEEALAKGCIFAAHGLGDMHFKGNGVEQDYKRAFEYYKQAEEAQDPDVFFVLGLSHHKGLGTSCDLKQACQYYELAIQKGHLGAAHNLAVIQLNSGISGEFLSEATLQDILKKLEPCVQKGYTRSTFIHAMIRLMLDPSCIKNVIEDLKVSISNKPHRGSKEAIEYLSLLFENEKRVTIADITILLTDPNPLALLKKMEQEEILEQHLKPENNKPNPLLLRKLNENNPKGKLQRLREDIAWFTDPNNIKGVNFKEFKRLMGEVAVLEEADLEILPSKGSNTRFQLSNNKDDKTICFSYHPRHRSGQGMDAAYDPKRARSLQAMMAKVAAR